MCKHIIIDGWACGCRLEDAHGLGFVNGQIFEQPCSRARLGGYRCGGVLGHVSEPIPWFCPTHHYQLIQRGIGPLFMSASQTFQSTATRIEEIPAQVVTQAALARANQMTERMHDCQNTILDLARTIHRQRSEAIREFFGEPAYSTFSDNWEAEAAQDHETPLVNVSHEEASVHPGWLDLRRRMEGVQRLALPEYDGPSPQPPPGGLGGVRDQWRDRPWDSTRPIYRFPGESNQEAEDRLAQGSDGDSSTPNDRPGIYIHLHHLKQLHHALRSEREELTNLPHRDPASEQ